MLSPFRWLSQFNTPPNALHPNAKFEGYYTKFTLPSGAKLILVICSVNKPTNSPNPVHNVTLTYIPHNAESRTWQTVLAPRTLTPHPAKASDLRWRIAAPDNSVIIAGPYHHTGRPNTDSMTYVVRLDDLGIHFSAQTYSPTPWSPRSPGPEGWLGALPLPLHWHVRSLSSKTSFYLRLPPAAGLDPRDEGGVATAHEEKNWADGFPSAHTWIQAFRDDDIDTDVEEGNSKDGEKQNVQRKGRLCLAGGKILGTTAYLVSYSLPKRAKPHLHPHSKTESATATAETESETAIFRPPFSLALGPFSPFMRIRRDWAARSMALSFTNLTRRLLVRASAPQGSFFAFDAPYAGGFLPAWMAQSARGTVRVELFRRRWGWFGWRWERVGEDGDGEEVFEDAGVEFGGDYFDERGSYEGWSVWREGVRFEMPGRRVGGDGVQVVEVDDSGSESVSDGKGKAE